jgi:hypothetical protein
MSTEEDAARPLTPKMHRFCLHFVEGDGPSQAYQAAYDAAKMGADSISTEAQRLLKDPRIQVRIAELRQTLQTSLGVSRGTLLCEIDEARELARAAGDARTMLNTTLAKAKILGFADHPVRPMNQSERAADRLFDLGKGE